MRGREAEWTYRLSPPEIVEIETAVKAVQASIDLAEQAKAHKIEIKRPGAPELTA